MHAFVLIYVCVACLLPTASPNMLQNAEFVQCQKHPSSCVKLDLRGQGLQGTIPNAVGQLSALEYLDLGGNDLTGTIPSEVSALTQLSLWFLDGNRLCGSVPRISAKLRPTTTLPPCVGSKSARAEGAAGIEGASAHSLRARSPAIDRRARKLLQSWSEVRNTSPSPPARPMMSQVYNTSPPPPPPPLLLYSYLLPPSLPPLKHQKRDTPSTTWLWVSGLALGLSVLVGAIYVIRFKKTMVGPNSWKSSDGRGAAINSNGGEGNELSWLPPDMPVVWRRKRKRMQMVYPPLKFITNLCSISEVDWEEGLSRYSSSASSRTTNSISSLEFFDCDAFKFHAAPTTSSMVCSDPTKLHHQPSSTQTEIEDACVLYMSKMTIAQGLAEAQRYARRIPYASRAQEEISDLMDTAYEACPDRKWKLELLSHGR